MARILLGVSGGIAAYKAVEFARLAGKAGHSVRVVQTRTSLEFVGRATFEGITGAPVLVDEFERDPARGAFPGEPAPDHDPISHLELVRRCDVYVIAPASANTIAKLADGPADNLLTSAALACEAPLLVAPAMNDAMYEHPATQANLETLAARGVTIVAARHRLARLQGRVGRGPAGRARRDPGRGRALLVRAAGLRAALARRPAGARHRRRHARADRLRALRRQPLVGPDGLRAWPRRPRAAGADVTLIAANVTLPRPAGVEWVDVRVGGRAGRRRARPFARCDVLVMAAAVADFRPASARRRQDQEGRARRRWRSSSSPPTDVLAALSAARRPGQTLVGFAAEHGEGAVERARGKLERKGLDAVVVNDISRPRHRLRRRAQRGDDRHRAPATRQCRAGPKARRGGGYRRLEVEALRSGGGASA